MRPRLAAANGEAARSRRFSSDDVTTAYVLRIIAGLEAGRTIRPLNFVDDCIVAVKFMQRRNTEQAIALDRFKQALKEKR